MYFKAAYISFSKVPLYTFEHFTPLHNSHVRKSPILGRFISANATLPCAFHKYEMRKGVIRTKRG